MENPTNNSSESIHEVNELKVPAVQLLFGMDEVSREAQLAVHDILKKVHANKVSLLLQLADYLRKKNQNIFVADTYTKQGHDLYKSELIKDLGLSDEDKALLAWYQQVRE